MPGSRSRSAWTTGLLAAATVAATAAGALPATALSGPEAPAAYTFTAALDVGDQRGCSATLVAPQWLLTAASCFADTPGSSVATGAPKLKTTATIGSGTQQVVNLVPRTDRDVVMAQLATPVSGITPAPVAATTPAAGDQVQAVGYGRTHDEWVPDHAHSAAFTVSSVGATTVDLAASADGAAICKGDTGGPALRTDNGITAIAAVHSLSWQGGCLGTDAAETRTTAVDARVDDIAAWIKQVAYSTTFAGAPWQDAEQMTAGYYTGGSAGGTRHMDLIVRWSDGEVTLYQGGQANDPAHPFAAEYQLAPRKSIWTHAVSINSVNATGGSTDGLVVRWNDGEMTQYTTVDAGGFHGEKQLAPSKTPAWLNDAHLLVAGRFTPGGHRDDLLVDWKDGHVSLFSDLATNGLTKQTQITAKNTTWTYASQFTTGSFTGNSTDDLLVRWVDGETTLYPGLTAKGLPAEVRIRPRNSDWADAAVVAAGAFTTNTAANDILVRWKDGHVSLYTGVDAGGLHDQIQLRPAG
ncbi:trypsin-like serine protease [Streptomyces sp. NPDC001393]